MADTCYYRAKKIILIASQNENGKWECELKIPELKKPVIGQYQGHSPGEYDTEQDAKMAAFAYAKKMLDPSADERQSASSGSRQFKRGR